MGLDPDKVLVLMFKDDRGTWFTCKLQAAQAVWPQLDGLCDWLGKSVKVGIESGEVERIELVG